MSRPDQRKKTKACLDKLRLPDEAVARASAMRLMQTGRFTGAKAWVYPCANCRGWHITSKYARDNAPGAVTAGNALVPSQAEGRA